MKAVIATVAATALLAVATPVPAAAVTDPVCAGYQRWRSLPERTAVLPRSNAVRQVRAASHDRCDRLVFDIPIARGTRPRIGYRVAYKPVVYSQGRGAPLPVAGAADLDVTLDVWSQSTARYTAEQTRPLTAIRQIRYGGSFEAMSTYAVGVRARLPFRVTVVYVADTAKVIVDIGHRWT